MRALPLVLAGAFLVQNVQSASAQASLRAERVQSAPAIDGRLDEDVWKTADTARGFRQIEPNEGAPATEPTELQVLYDNANLYVGVRLYDSEPSKIVKRLSRRDDDADADRFTFYVDALNDHLTGAHFEVSAGGVQRDAIISNRTGVSKSFRTPLGAANSSGRRVQAILLTTARDCSRPPVSTRNMRCVPTSSSTQR